MDLRCDSKKHAELIEPGVIEMKCRSRFCGASKDVVVIHRFDTMSGKLVGTTKYKNPKGHNTCPEK